METFKTKLSNPWWILVAGVLLLILGSARWTVGIAPWLGLAAMLYFTRNVTTWKAIVFGFLALFLSGLVGADQVIPAPMPFLLIILLILSAKALLPYLVDRLVRAREKGLLGTLVFPAALVSLEYLNVLASGDVWGSIANTQYGFQPIRQIASVFGIWGISFLIGWFASLLNWMADRRWQWPQIRNGVLLAGSVYLAVLGFGIARIYLPPAEHPETVSMGGVTLNNSNFGETLYEEAFGKSISIPAGASQTAPELREVSRALPSFIEDPYAEAFKGSRAVMQGNLDELFARTSDLAGRGARIVVWSEAIGLILAPEESEVVERGKALAREKGIYLFMSLGVINPGPYDPDRLLLVNKTVTLTPEGTVANVYLKSNPVPFAEQDYGSDDIIPVIESPYGKLSPVICYDADFPLFMQQAGQAGTDILIIPSGDWKAIDPYHPHMASLRGIENGASVFRPVSRATSIATDPYGNLLGSSDFFGPEEKTLLVEVPTHGVPTLYNRIGDVLPYAAMVFVAFILIEALVKVLLGHNRRSAEPAL
ncbi:nitrilase-related carbon-nitrogen hydrolase [Robiginitalea sp. SC105]|uniref:nitrilase-related carbon-nitrogen hydrolase n=1 Tax=Robiginitalea sp. SC105 TaxID=2762332 RepID=UPI00163B22DC|nr:nitrilase-related carbon-nitrogen hydrolase [Robiginitalea sp. SC105]MBC2838693.1 hypothetical protein [Robiginitalea sp. SC105]